MELNADFSQRVAVHAARLPWVSSPMAGVERRMLDRIGDEVARATSIVRYAPGGHFSPHTHGGGEARRRVPGRARRVRGRRLHSQPTHLASPTQVGTGLILFVKLWQFDAADRHRVGINTATMAYTPAADRGPAAA